MATNRSPLYQLLAARLGKDPVEDIRSRREAGQSWRTITILYLTDYQVSVTDVTLRNWVAQAEQEQEAPA